jgi:hypothetical protein
MKFDADYFNSKMFTIEACRRSDDMIPILRRIALDSRREALEEAAEIAFKEWSKCAKLPRIGIFAYTKRIIDAISSLEGK